MDKYFKLHIFGVLECTDSYHEGAVVEIPHPEMDDVFISAQCESVKDGISTLRTIKWTMTK